jgi:exocyst complex component 3
LCPDLNASTVIEAFDEHLIEFCRNILYLARAGHPEVIVKIIKIAEVEGKEDEKARVTRILNTFFLWFTC